MRNEEKNKTEETWVAILGFVFHYAERVFTHYPDFAIHMNTMANKRQSNAECGIEDKEKNG